MQAPESTLFPLDNVDPKLKNGEWLAAIGRNLDAKYRTGAWYYNFGDRGRMWTIRQYSDGRQDIQKYIDMWAQAGDEKTTGVQQVTNTTTSRAPIGSDRVKRKGYANISFELVTIAPMIQRTVEALLGTDSQKVDIEALSPEARNKKVKAKNKTFLKAKMASFMKSLGKPIKEEYFRPSDEVSLEMYELLGGFNLNFEIAGKKLIQHAFDISNYHKLIEPKLKRDTLDLNFIVTQIYNDSVSGAVKVKYVDVPSYICAYLNETLGNNTPFAGHYEKYSIPDFRNMLLCEGVPEIEAENLVNLAAASWWKAYTSQGAQTTGWNYFNDKDPVTGRWRYDEFFVEVLHFEYITRDREFYKFRERDNGRTDFYKDEYGDTKEGPRKRTETIDTHCIYEGWYVACINKAFGGKQANMMRINKKSPVLSYTMQKVNGKSIGESLIPIHDSIMIGHLKLQAAKLAAKPKGIAIEIASLNGLNLGGQLFTPQEIVKVYSHTGTMFYKAVLQQGKVVASGMPIQELEGGIGKQLTEWITSYAHDIERALQISGISPVMAAGQKISGEKLVGVANAEQDATMNNLYPLQSALEDMKREVAEKILMKTLVSCANDPKVKEYYAGIIGADSLDELLLATGLTLDELGVKVTRRVTEQEKLHIREALARATAPGQNGEPLATPADALLVQQMVDDGRVEEAARYLQYIENERRKVQSEQAAMASQQQSEQLMQLEQLKIQGEIQKHQAIVQVDLQKEVALSAIRMKERSVEIKEEMDSEAYLLRLEGIVQLATQKDVGTKIPVQNSAAS